jgi:hypothetical protein
VNRVNCEIVLDIRGIEIFWRIADAFQSGGTPDESLWTCLFETPGYEALTRSEYTPENLRKAISIGLDPERAYEARISSGTRLGQFVEHFRKAADRRLEIEAVVEELKNRSSRLGAMISDLVEGTCRRRALEGISR